MQVTVKLFASAREAVGMGELQYDLEAPATAGDLVAQLQERYPKLADFENAGRVAVNLEFCSLEMALSEGDEISLIPPVSGG